MLLPHLDSPDVLTGKICIGSNNSGYLYSRSELKLNFVSLILKGKDNGYFK